MPWERPLVRALLSEKAVLTILSPFEIHFLVILLDEALYLVDFPVVQFASVLENRIPIALHEEFAWAALGQLFIAGMNVHIHSTVQNDVKYR